MGLAAIMLLVSAPIAEAQGLFSPARKVNDRVITNFDVEQRIAFMEALNVGAADMREEAITRLTEEAVQRDYARRHNIRIDMDELADGMSEFAARAEMSSDEFISALREVGVDRETFEGFVEAGLMWRQAVRRTLPPLVPVTDSDVDRARDVAAILGTQRVLISEIFLPTDPEFADPVAQIMEMIESARSIEEFSEIAREFSLAGTRDQGGRLPDWVPVENLPGQIAEPISEARPGQIIGPIDLGEAIAYFQLRASDSSRDIPPDQVFVTYKRLALPGGESAENLARVERIKTETRHCEGLGRFAQGLPEEALEEREAFVNEMSGADAVALARLDRNEITTMSTEAGQLVVLMLCSRELQFEDRPGDGQMEEMVFDRRIGAMADLKLQELIADADIRDY